ncbi:MAG: chemotaxis protein CheR [Deltaproteobacteria bacterium]|nr:chemotaxis protein CheR [Deltaproteobacteria bacterium]
MFIEAGLFKKFCKIANEKAGISLNDNKQALVTARVAKRLRILKMGTAREYMHYLQADESGEELIHFLDAISTNFTSFMREPEHFDILGREVKQWMNTGRQRIRLWCAASSSGEEPYSIVITVLDTLDGHSMDFKLLATDISTKVLGIAQKGVYTGDTVRPLTKGQRLKYLNRLTPRSAEEQIFEVKPEVRKRIVYKRLNLAKPPFPMQGPLDGVMCRNVMIYFDKAVRQGLVSEAERLLRPGAFLMTGHSETLTGIQSSFQVVKPSIYRKPMNTN